MKLVLYPNVAASVKLNNKPVSDLAISNVRAFFFLYLMTLLIMSLLVTATGLDHLSSLSSVAQAMANAGPGLGPVVGPSTTFASIPDTAKWLICVSMIMGRLELVTFFIVLQPWFWQRWVLVSIKRLELKPKPHNIYLLTMWLQLAILGKIHTGTYQKKYNALDLTGKVNEVPSRVEVQLPSLTRNWSAWDSALISSEECVRVKGFKLSLYWVCTWGTQHTANTDN